MAMMVWGGTPLRIKVVQSASGKHDPGFGRDVYAIQDNDGDVSVLVVDDEGHLGWVGRTEFTVIGGKRMG